MSRIVVTGCAQKTHALTWGRFGTIVYPGLITQRTPARREFAPRLRASRLVSAVRAVPTARARRQLGQHAEDRR